MAFKLDGKLVSEKEYKKIKKDSSLMIKNINKTRIGENVRWISEDLSLYKGKIISEDKLYFTIEGKSEHYNHSGNSPEEYKVLKIKVYNA